MHGVFHGQRVQIENPGHRLHLELVGFVQADPREGGLTLGFELVNFGQGGAVGVLAGQSLAGDVDRAVDGGPCDRDVDAFGVDLRGVRGAVHPEQRRWQSAE